MTYPKKKLKLKIWRLGNPQALATFSSALDASRGVVINWIFLFWMQISIQK